MSLPPTIPLLNHKGQDNNKAVLVENIWVGITAIMMIIINVVPSKMFSMKKISK